MFLDASGILAYLDDVDRRHAFAVELLKPKPFCLTHSYVLAELIPLARSRGTRWDVVFTYSCEIIDSSASIKVVWVDSELHRAGLDLIRRRADKDYSLCDAISFVLMRRYGLRESLTTDRHFDQEGFTRLLIS